MAQTRWEQIALPGVGHRPLELHRLDVVIDLELRQIYIAHTIRDANTGAPVFGELHPGISSTAAVECVESATKQFHDKVLEAFDPF